MALRLSELGAVHLENGKTLLRWLDRFSYYSPKKILITANEPDRFSIQIFTEGQIYGITATPKYLGCTCGSRKPRPGEKYGRGNDLPDGPFELNTLLKILGAILFYEAKEVVKPRHPAPANEEEKVTEAAE